MMPVITDSHRVQAARPALVLNSTGLRSLQKGEGEGEGRESLREGEGGWKAQGREGRKGRRGRERSLRMRVSTVRRSLRTLPQDEQIPIPRAWLLPEGC